MLLYFVLLFYIIHQMFISIALEKEPLKSFGICIFLNSIATIVGYWSAIWLAPLFSLGAPKLFGTIFCSLFYPGIWFLLLNKKSGNFARKVFLVSLSGLFTAIVCYKFLRAYVGWVA